METKCKQGQFIPKFNHDKDLKMAKKLGLSLYHNDIFTEKSNAKWTRAYIYDEKDNVYIFYVQENPHDKAELDPSRNFNYELVRQVQPQKEETRLAKDEEIRKSNLGHRR